MQPFGIHIVSPQIARMHINHCTLCIETAGEREYAVRVCLHTQVWHLDVVACFMHKTQFIFSHACCHFGISSFLSLSLYVHLHRRIEGIHTQTHISSRSDIVCMYKR